MQIDMDIPRTHSDEAHVREQMGVIRSMLLQQAAEDEELGYCQGMNLVAATYAATSKSHADAYHQFHSFIQEVRGLWLPGFPLLEVATVQFTELAQDRSWFQHITACDVEPGMYLPQALLTFFATWLPLSTRVQCIKKLDGRGLPILLSITLAVLDHIGAELLRARDLEEILTTLQDIKSMAPTADVLWVSAEKVLPTAAATKWCEHQPSSIRIVRRQSMVVDLEGREVFGNNAENGGWIGDSFLTWINKEYEECAQSGHNFFQWAWGQG